VKTKNDVVRVIEAYKLGYESLTRDIDYNPSDYITREAFDIGYYDAMQDMVGMPPEQHYSSSEEWY